MAAIVDSSILMRLLLVDNGAQAAAAEQFISTTEDELLVAPTTLSEVTYVLRGARLKRSRETTIEAIELLLSLPLKFLDADVVNRALDLFRNVHDDWDDCVAASFALLRADASIVAYDRDFDRIPGLSRIEPPMVTTA